MRPAGCAREQRRRKRERGTRERLAGRICRFARAKSAALLQPGALRAQRIEDGPGRHREYRLENGGDGARRNSGADTRVGGGTCKIWDSRERGGAGGSDDAALRAVARHISECAGKTKTN